jgi:hypothetical protein
VIGGIINSGASVSHVSRVSAFIHPGYRSNFLVHDVALLRLQTPFDIEDIEDLGEQDSKREKV